MYAKTAARPACNAVPAGVAKGRKPALVKVTLHCEFALIVQVPTTMLFERVTKLTIAPAGIGLPCLSDILHVKVA